MFLHLQPPSAFDYLNNMQGNEFFTPRDVGSFIDRAIAPLKQFEKVSASGFALAIKLQSELPPSSELESHLPDWLRDELKNGIVELILTTPIEELKALGGKELGEIFLGFALKVSIGSENFGEIAERLKACFGDTTFELRKNLFDQEKFLADFILCSYAKKERLLIIEALSLIVNHVTPSSVGESLAHIYNLNQKNRVPNCETIAKIAIRLCDKELNMFLDQLSKLIEKDYKIPESLLSDLVFAIIDSEPKNGNEILEKINEVCKKNDLSFLVLSLPYTKYYCIASRIMKHLSELDDVARTIDELKVLHTKPGSASYLLGHGLMSCLARLGSKDISKEAIKIFSTYPDLAAEASLEIIEDMLAIIDPQKELTTMLVELLKKSEWCLAHAERLKLLLPKLVDRFRDNSELMDSILQGLIESCEREEAGFILGMAKISDILENFPESENKRYILSFLNSIEGLRESDLIDYFKNLYSLKISFENQEELKNYLVQLGDSILSSNHYVDEKITGLLNICSEILLKFIDINGEEIIISKLVATVLEKLPKDLISRTAQNSELYDSVESRLGSATFDNNKALIEILQPLWTYLNTSSFLFDDGA